MPYLTEHVDEGKGLLRTGVGVVTAADIISAVLRQGQDAERARNVHYALVDFTQVTELRLSGEQIRQIVEANRKTAAHTLPGTVRVALIATQPLTYGLTRMWQTLADDLGWKIQVFRTRPAAIAWLVKELVGDDLKKLAEYPTLQKFSQEI